MKNTKIIIFTILIAIIWCVIGYRLGNNDGYKNGVEHGITITLDTIQCIIDKQIAAEDTAVTKIIFEKSDTMEYFLSKKTIK